MPIVIGLTGGIASGKSTVSGMLIEMGAEVIDADVEARLAVEKGEPAYNTIISYFGTGVLADDASIDRAKLGSIIFNDQEKRGALNSMVHPAVRERMLAKKEQAVKTNKKVIVLDIPLLFESQLTWMVEKTIVVYVNEQVQLKRLMDRNGYTEEEAKTRIRSQMPLKEKAELADAVIDNNGTLENTRTQLIEILKSWNIDV